MKNYFQIARGEDYSLRHLALSVFIAFYVMLYVNIFIGSTGGLAAFIAYLFVFYNLRGAVFFSKEKDFEKKKLIGFYGIAYVIIWAAAKFFLLVIKISGWGNIHRLTMGEYIQNLYGGTMLEIWAYFFASILMLAFVMSLFPLVILKQWKKWLLYLGIDSGCFSVVCWVIDAVCRLFIKDDLEARASSVLDDLLLCELPKQWQAVLYILGILCFLIGVIIGSYQFVIRMSEDSRAITQVGKNMTQVLTSRQKNVVLVLVGGGTIILVGMIAGFFFIPSKETGNYKKVAEYLTEDDVLGPMKYKDEIYIPMEGRSEVEEGEAPLGYLASKGQNCESRFYRLAISNILYQNQDGALNVRGQEPYAFCRVDQLEDMDSWKKDEVFLLWDEEWKSETAYSNEVTGYTECQKNLVETLEKKFGKVSYEPSYFLDYDAYFTIKGYKDLKDAVESEKPMGDWVGCILVKDNKFYYGNYDNWIIGYPLEVLLDVLGGN